MEGTLAYAVIEDVPVSWHDYRSALSDRERVLLAGLILHVAGPTDEGVRTIGVWKSEEAWQRSCAARPRESGAVEPVVPATLRVLRVEHLLRERRWR